MNEKAKSLRKVKYKIFIVAKELSEKSWEAQSEKELHYVLDNCIKELREVCKMNVE